MQHQNTKTPKHQTLSFKDLQSICGGYVVEEKLFVPKNTTGVEIPTFTVKTMGADTKM